MMEFFRRHQRLFLIALSAVIIISFSFFGTYSTVMSRDIPDNTVFTAVDGREVKRSELDQLIRFIATNNDDKILSGGLWGPNFLNDGVIQQDFFSTSIISVIAFPYLETLAIDLEPRLAKEKNYQSYAHPTAPFVTAENVWDYFMPQVGEDLKTVRQAKSLTEENFDARVRLFLSQYQFPPHYLRQVLQYQQQQNQWAGADPALDHQDLSLFGYHTLEDWFGPRLIQLMAETIINGAAIAERNGLSVTDEEALAQLLRNNEISFRQQQQSQNPHLGVRNREEYFQEQLRLLGMDRTAAIRAWQQVLLFRRLLDTAAGSAWVDPLFYNDYHNYAQERIQLDLYQLQPALHLKDAQALQRFEKYLTATTNKSSLLDIPTVFKPLEEIKRDTPQLVQKRYLLEVAQVTQEQLELRVGVRTTWDWELDDSHWSTLIQRFPELAVTSPTTRDERFAALEKLSRNTRQLVDNFAKEQIVLAHPEWLQEALDNAPPQEMIIGIAGAGGMLPFPGMLDAKELQTLLDAETPSEKLQHWTPDNLIYYKIRVLERNPEPTLLTFAEADRGSVLKEMVDQGLEAQYATLSGPDFVDATGQRKPFEEVRDKVAEKVYAPLYAAIAKEAKEQGSPWDPKLQKSFGDFCASQRFAAHLRQGRDALSKNPETATQWVEQAAVEPGSLLANTPPADQWKLVKSSEMVTRSAPMQWQESTLFALPEGQWTNVIVSQKEPPYFAQVTHHLPPEKNAAHLQEEGQRLLANDAKCYFMTHYMGELREKGALVLPQENPNTTDGLSAE